MHTLIIRHFSSTSDNQPYSFRVERQKDGRHSDEATITAPTDIHLENRPDSNLSRDLRWYLEQFLSNPQLLQTGPAEQIRRALHDWGVAAFNALFERGRSRDFYRDAFQTGLEQLTLKIASDDPRILAWPWEALVDPQAAPLAHACRIVRQLNELHDPLALPENLSRERIRILLICARPLERDISFSTLSRPLLELIERERLPAAVDLLRSPTFERLREVLLARPGYYHIVHFDGHGDYGAAGAGGRLLFETDDGEADAIDARDLGILLREYRIPIMVLNACRSAMLDEQEKDSDAFASVAASLQRAGIRSVVAMAYALYADAVRVFVPAFYRRLLQTGRIDVLEVVRAGRQALLRNKQRRVGAVRQPLDDWLVPVVYQQGAEDFDFLTRSGDDDAAGDTDAAGLLPPELALIDNRYGCIGRDGALLTLERALRRAPAGIVIHGTRGVGKTTLAASLLRWLAATAGWQELYSGSILPDSTAAGRCSISWSHGCSMARRRTAITSRLSSG